MGRLRVGYCFSRIVAVLVAAFTAGLSAQEAAAATAAFVNFDSSAIGKALEARLLKKIDVAWVERSEIQRVLQERRLQELFSASGVGERRALGELVRADVLILLRSAPTSDNSSASGSTPGPAPAASRRLDLVICETAQGLRIGVYSLPLTSANGEAEAAVLQRLADWVDEALRRVTRATRDVIAVPPLVSRDLAHTHDHLKRAYADLLAQAALERGDLAVVELAEAEALVKEKELTADRRRLERRLPLYFIGDYRHDGQGAALRVTLQLKLTRGDETIASAISRPLPPSEAPTFLLRAVAEALGKVAGAPPVAADRGAEAKQLTARARDFMDLGSYAEARSLLEASLLLRPDDEPTRRAAIIAYGTAFSEFTNIEPDAAVVAAGLSGFLRALDHLETWYAGNPNVGALPQAIGSGDFINNLHLFRALKYRPVHPGPTAVYAEMKPSFAAAFMRIGRLRSKQGVADAARYFNLVADDLPDSKSRFVFLGDLILELQHLPNARHRSSFLLSRLHEPGGAELLSRLEKQGTSEIRELAVRLKPAPISTVSMSPLPGQANIVALPHRNAGEARKHEPKLPLGPTKLRLQPQELRWNEGSAPIPSVSGMIPAGPGIDVMWDGSSCYRIKEPGVVRRFYHQTEVNSGMRAPGQGNFDGRYVWTTAWRDRKAPQLLVLNPDTGSVRDVTAEVELPLMTTPDPGKQNNDQMLAVTALAPDRAFVVGSYGRAWMAIIDFDYDAKHKVRMLHEFTRTPDDIDPDAWKDVDAGFLPTYVAALGDRAAGTQRVFVGRKHRNLAIANHPLLVDPERGTVEVMADEFPWFNSDGQVTIHAGRLYYLAYRKEPRAIGLYRLGPPTWKPEPLQFGMPQGILRISDGRVHIIGKSWWSIDLKADGSPDPAGPYLVDDKVPWHYANPWVYPTQTGGDYVSIPRDTERMSNVSYSTHYGLLVSTYVDTPPAEKLHQPVISLAPSK